MLKLFSVHASVVMASANFARRFLTPMFNEIIRLQEVESTHLLMQRMADKAELRCGTVISADYQTGGRGQGANRWHSEPGMNILMSLGWCPKSLPASGQFGISMAVALSVVSLLKQYEIPDIRIKWPNDIWSGRRKIAGMLVSNTVAGNRISLSIISIGLNVNQLVFPAELPNPVSMRRLTGKNYDREELLHRLLVLIGGQLEAIDNERPEIFKHAYLSNLLGLGEERMFDISGEKMICKIGGVDEFGRMVLQHADGTRKAYDMSEARMLQ